MRAVLWKLRRDIATSSRPLLIQIVKYRWCIVLCVTELYASPSVDRRRRPDLPWPVTGRCVTGAAEVARCCTFGTGGAFSAVLAADATVAFREETRRGAGAVTSGALMDRGCRVGGIRCGKRDGEGRGGLIGEAALFWLDATGRVGGILFDAVCAFA